MRKKISQRDAHRYKKQAEALAERDRQRLNAWNRDFFGGVHLNSTVFTSYDSIPREILTAIKLGNYVVCKAEDQKVMFYAVKP